MQSCGSRIALHTSNLRKCHLRNIVFSFTELRVWDRTIHFEFNTVHLRTTTVSFIKLRVWDRTTLFKFEQVWLRVSLRIENGSKVSLWHAESFPGASVLWHSGPAWTREFTLTSRSALRIAKVPSQFLSLKMQKSHHVCNRATNNTNCPPTKK